MKRILFLLLLISIENIIYSQNEEDVLRYSTTDIFGSARFEAMAGSFGGLGADLSAIQINPASMGRFSSSTTSLSFNNSFSENTSLFNGTSAESHKNKFTISNIGAVFTTDLSDRSVGRKYSQFTLSYNRLKNFSNYRIYEGEEYNSLLDVFADDGFGIVPEEIYQYRPFTTGLAYDVYAVDYDGNSLQYFSRLTNGNMYHNRQIRTGGGIGEFHIGYSENYMHKLYYGGSLGIRRVNYSEEYTHYEKLLDTLGTSLRSFNYMYEQTTNGTGVNIKLGIIYLPMDELRLGFSFESPTVFKLEDRWAANMTALHDDGLHSVSPEYIPEGKYNYRIKTPMKLRGSIAYVFAMRGAINMDLELNNLPRGLLKPELNAFNSANVYTFSYENEEVKRQYKTILNTRIGIEYMVLNDIFIRGGIAILPQPYKQDINQITHPNMTYSAGIGWERKFFSIDLSYRLLKIATDYYAFDPSQIENRTEFKTNVHNIVLTAGLKF